MTACFSTETKEAKTMDNVFIEVGGGVEWKHIIHLVKRSFKNRTEIKGIPQAKGKWSQMEATLQERMKSTRQNKYGINIKAHFLF